MLVCSNDCTQYYMLYKTENVNDYNLYKAAQKLDNIIAHRNNGHDIFLPILKQLEDQGIEYAEFVQGGNTHD